MLRLWNDYDYEIKQSDWTLCVQNFKQDPKVNAKEAIRFILKKFIPDDQLKNMSATGQGTSTEFGNVPVDVNLKTAIRSKVNFKILHRK